MMLTLGLFVFALDTLPYQQFQRDIKWRHPNQARVGAVPGTQFLGRDADTITLTGVLAPELTGGTMSLKLIESMADTGQSWPLIEGTGVVYGLFIVESLNTTRTLFFRDGAARRIEFSLSLKRTDNDDVDNLGSITSGLLDMLGLA